jgi:hydrogenase maturation protease
MRALVAGIGNIFFADDGFGVEVARRLDDREVPAGVQVADFGIRGVHLAYELLYGYDLLVLVDAMSLGKPPGTLAVIEVETDLAEPSGGLDAHTMTPATVLANLERLGGHVERILVVACQPAAIEEGIGLSPAVAAAVDGAADLVLDVLNDSLVNGREPRWA